MQLAFSAADVTDPGASARGFECYIVGATATSNEVDATIILTFVMKKFLCATPLNIVQPRGTP
jgi:hypothetical protein